MKKNTRMELKVSKIESGTVIDHLKSGKAIEIIKELKLIEERPNAIISLTSNVPSKTSGVKDILKIEGKRLSHDELLKLYEMAPDATVNIIKDYEVIKKAKIKELISD
ncbi:MAG: aspartate carbamoyltransferase regulatory subunit [Candidatus Aenigmarchaeota archaeon]|nr:aspartate carbamoyltransferase regulatory subunit [Candidatus Aenigmarchaeota archaeon]